MGSNSRSGLSYYHIHGTTNRLGQPDSCLLFHHLPAQLLHPQRQTRPRLSSPNREAVGGSWRSSTARARRVWKELTGSHGERGCSGSSGIRGGNTRYRECLIHPHGIQFQGGFWKKTAEDINGVPDIGFYTRQRYLPSGRAAPVSSR